MINIQYVICTYIIYVGIYYVLAESYKYLPWHKYIYYIELVLQLSFGQKCMHKYLQRSQQNIRITKNNIFISYTGTGTVICVLFSLIYKIVTNANFDKNTHRLYAKTKNCRGIVKGTVILPFHFINQRNNSNNSSTKKELSFFLHKFQKKNTF